MGILVVFTYLYIYVTIFLNLIYSNQKNYGILITLESIFYEVLLTGAFLQYIVNKITNLLTNCVDFGTMQL
ncbi:MAG: hypothetical protein K0S47_2979 [Herbinix sp.]|nr:hypothetical protein [Herbinix sp.]